MYTAAASATGISGNCNTRATTCKTTTAQINRAIEPCEMIVIKSVRAPIAESLPLFRHRPEKLLFAHAEEIQKCWQHLATRQLLAASVARNCLLRCPESRSAAYLRQLSLALLLNEPFGKKISPHVGTFFASVDYPRIDPTHPRTPLNFLLAIMFVTSRA